MEQREAVVCAGEAGINALATVRSLGRRGVPVHVFSIEPSREIASASRYCRSSTRVASSAELAGALLDFAGKRGVKPVLYVDNDPMLRLLAPHAGALAGRFELVEPLDDAERLTDKTFQVEAAKRCGLLVPRTWFPESWPELRAIRSAKRLIAKPRAGRASFKAIIGRNPEELAARLRGLASPAEVLVQEFVEGGDDALYAGLTYRAKSVDRCFAMSARKLRQSRQGAGVMAVGQAVDAPQVREMTRRLARAIGVRGVFCTEFKLDASDGRLYFVEWNPRPAYFQSIGWKAGFDLAWLAWCDHADPGALPARAVAESAGHYWINVHFDLMHLARAPHLARELRTWRPYLGRTEWAVLAFDDVRPWTASMRKLLTWLRGGFARRSAAGRAAPQA